MEKTITREDITHPAHLLALGFGAGLIKPAPGTWGSVVGAMFFAPLLLLPMGWYVLILIMAAGLGIYVCHKSAKDWGVHDHGAIVWDEVVGMGIALMFLPLSWQSVLLAFVTFRVFDIWKPWPVNVLDQKLEGGVGIMADDMAAGLLAAIVGYVIWSAF